MMPHVLHCWVSEVDPDTVVIQRRADNLRQSFLPCEEFMDLFGFLPPLGKQVAIPFGPPGRPTALHEEEAA